ncbi:MAG: hypothetical protein Q9O24_10030 [Gammaproteobacteria bacterium]|nr:hypothetical protein [Gammaproteobacteria bacterium]
MKSVQRLAVALFLSCFSLFFPHLALAEGISPSHVYQNTQRMMAEISLIRQKLGAQDTPRHSGVQVKKKPIHVYAKALEVMEKVARAQTRQGLTPTEVGSIPIRNISPTEVFAVSERILLELRRLKKKLEIAEEIQEPQFVAGKRPSDAYENMWNVSYLLDAVAGEIKPSFVFRNSRLILAELGQISTKLGFSVLTKAPESVANKQPKDVNLQSFKNMHLLARLQRKLNIEPLRAPSFPNGKITPSDVYDTTHILLAELVRIKVALEINTPRPEVELLEGKHPADVLSQMQLIAENIRALTKS